MPGGDGTGPAGAGPATGRGMGGRNAARSGRGGGFAFGPGGECVCPQCGKTADHHRGVPCYTTACPECGAAMMRPK